MKSLKEMDVAELQKYIATLPLDQRAAATQELRVKIAKDNRKK